MKSIEQSQISKLDEEWVSLMIAAKNLGFNPAEVREFIRKKGFLKFKKTYIPIQAQQELEKRYYQSI